MALNVLITSSGSQRTLVEAFVLSLGAGGGKVFTADVRSWVASADVSAQHLVAPPFDSEDYPQWLVRTCAEMGVGLLFSLNEQELLIQEGVRGQLQESGCALLGVSSQLLLRVTDKWLLGSYLCDLGLHVIPSSLLESGQVPLGEKEFIIKPRKGRGSRGIMRVNDSRHIDAVKMLIASPSDYIIQPVLDGQQYCVDIVNDLSGHYRGTLIRRRLLMGAEETQVAETVEDPEIEEVCRTLGQAMQHQGVADVELLRHNGRLYIFDVNVRFGGGYMFSHIAGANVPRALILWCLGKDASHDLLSHTCGVVGMRSTTVSPLKGSFSHDDS